MLKSVQVQRIASFMPYAADVPFQVQFRLQQLSLVYLAQGEAHALKWRGSESVKVPSTSKRTAADGYEVS